MGTQVNPWTPTSAFMSRALGPKPCLVPVSHDLEAEDLTVELSGPATLTNVYIYLCIGSKVVRENEDNSGIRTWDLHLERRQPSPPN